jgi:DNA-binding beta-propeller fold protein YncE
MCKQFGKGPSAPVVVGPDTRVAGLPLTFKATSEDPDGDTVAFTFDWGDTTTNTRTRFVESDETISVSHTYADSGYYSVKAKAKNGKGGESNWSSIFSFAVSSAGPGFPDSLVATIPMPGGGVITSFAVSPDGQTLFAALGFDTRILVVRTSDNHVTDTLRLGSNPWRLAFSRDGQFLYAMFNGPESLLKVRVADRSVVARTAIGRNPQDMVISPSGDYLYVVCCDEASVLKVRASDDSVVSRIPVDSASCAIAMGPDGADFYTVSPGKRAVSAYSATSGALLRTQKMACQPTSVSVSPDGNRLYVGAWETLFVIPSALGSVDKKLPLYPLSSPQDAVLMPDGSYAMVATGEYHGIAMVRTANDEIVGWPHVWGCLVTVAPSPDGNTLYAGDDYGAKRICVFRRRGVGPVQAP